jgi:diaminopimelate epimerase
MKQHFFKYQACGNDFIMIDNRNASFDANNDAVISKMCQRHFGIGADGLILLEEEAPESYRMRYYNADGKEGSMCGNGGRTFVAFCKSLGLVDNKMHFKAIDGMHNGEILVHKHPYYLIALGMQNCTAKTAEFINTGSPHHIAEVKNLEDYDVFKHGEEIRYSAKYPEGVNVNFTEKKGDSIHVRTYERGVEDETLACGTGVTAVALSYAIKEKKEGQLHYQIHTKGGILEIDFKKDNNIFEKIILTAEARFVFEGDFSL